MLHLNTQMYNNEQVSKVLDRISVEPWMHKNGFFGCKSQKSPSAGGSASRPPGGWGLCPQTPTQVKRLENV